MPQWSVQSARRAAAGLTVAGIGLVVFGLSGCGSIVKTTNAATVTGSGQLSSLACSQSAMTGSGTDNCTVTLDGSAGSGGLSVSLSSSSGAVTVPSAVMVPEGASSATFEATVAAVSSTQAGTLTAAAGGLTQTFALNLNAATRVLTASLSNLAFGEVTVNSSAEKSLVLQSTGTEALTISAASLTGLGFSVSGGGFPITLNPNQEIVLQVQFAPASAGAATGLLTISSDAASGTTMVVNLSGTGTTASSSGTGAILSVNATTVAFGRVSLKTAATQSVTLTSTGSAAVTVSGATVTGTGFTLSGGGFPITLNPGQSAVLNVVFTPTVAGAGTGRLTISSNSTTGATTAVALTGTGVSTTTYAVDLTWNAPASSSDAVVGYHIYRATGTSSSYQRLNSSTNVPTTYTDTTVQSGQKYVYTVTSVDASGLESVDSNLFTATIP
ncbi:MAG TPA: choice-of-anchor D domain-containing protein [Acidobacteriaceae bacterium]